MIQQRLDMQQVTPNAGKAIMALEEYLGTTNLKPLHKEIIKLRASIINKCAYCIDMHTKDLRKLGETEQRLYLLSAWKETTVFSEEEQAILAITDEITELPQQGVTNETYTNALTLFGAEYLSHIIMAIITINAWNRLAVATNMGLLVIAE
ncbi:MAG: carboxymuconolactone decarboxylase family protein [Flavipsychrobacter sp.]